ncbi:MAG: helix-turn-helix transcriptional regulator, partial [Clostridiales bacterium]|nr:helix-turn-helix transcriptional regulator [Clostridiales bacterium]
ALINDSSFEAVILPLTVVNGLGGSYTQYFSITFPIYFYRKAKRPVFIASLGIVSLLANSVLEWRRDLFLPEAFREIGAPLLASVGVSAVMFILLVHFVFARHQEMTLDAALHALLFDRAHRAGQRSGEMPGDDGITPGGTDKDQDQASGIDSLGLTEEEMKVARLLIDGMSRRDIYRKLHLSAAVVMRHENTIRQKLDTTGGHDHIVAAVVEEYGLTNRETEILVQLNYGQSPDRIAEALFITIDTVKWHMGNLMDKLEIEDRGDLTAWLDGRLND